MILATHALTGAVLGKNIDNPTIIIAAALAVHFLMDSLRHGEYFDSRIAGIKDTWFRIFLDISIGFSLIAGAVLLQFESLDYTTFLNIIIGVFFSMLPDGLTLLFWKFNWRWLARIKDFHSWAHRYGCYPRFSPERQWTFRNAINDIVISAIAFAALLFF